MSYRPNYLATRRLPAYTGFAVMLIAIGVTVVLSSNSFGFVSKATVGAEPKNIQVSNVSATTFTISYTTDAPALGSVGYGNDAASATVVLDDRDTQTGTPAEHQVHYFTVKNLTPNSTYYYIIRSGDQQATDNGKPFQISTPASSSAEPTAITVSGSVATSEGGTATEGIVTLTADGSQQLSGLVGTDGTYKIPLAGLLNNTYTTPVTIQPTSVLQLTVLNATQQSNAKVLASKADQVPKITLAQNYDFTLSPDPIASDSAAASSSSMLPLQTPAPVSSPEITSPSDAQTYKDQQPTFSGRALPNAAVDVTIQSQQEITAQLQSDDSGSWQFKPPVQLEPGKHTITIKSPDASGILQTISKSFTVYAAGSQFVEPSVSPIQVSPTIASASPTLAPSPTASPSPTLQPTPAVTVPASREPVTPTGSSAVINGFIGGIITIGIGALLFIFTTI